MVDSSKLGAIMPDVMQRRIAGSSFLRRCWSYLFSLRISRVKIQQQGTRGVGLGTLQMKLWRVAVPCRNIEFKILKKAQNTFNSSVCLSVCHKKCHNINWRKQEAEGLLLSPAGLVGFSAGRRLQKLSSAPRALARLQF